MKPFLLFNFWFEALTYLFDLSLISQTPHAVQWMRPEAQEGCPVSDWFNMLVLHQNRLCVSETVLVCTSVWKCLYVFFPAFLEKEMSRFVFEILPNLDILTFTLSIRIIKIVSCIVIFFFYSESSIVVCRVKTNPKNAINEHFLPRFLDFIVWGHEHECLVDPQVPLAFFFSTIFFVCISLNWRWVLI